MRDYEQYVPICSEIESKQQDVNLKIVLKIEEKTDPIKLEIICLELQQRAKQTDFLPSYDVKLVVFKRMWWILNCCHALGMNIY